MMTRNRILIDNYRICLLSFEKIFKNIEVSMLNDLLLYGLISNNTISLKNSDTKKLVYHHLIHGICNTVLRYKKHYKYDVIILYDHIINDESEISTMITRDKLYIQLERIIKDISKVIPIVIRKCTDTIDNDYFNTGEGIELVHKITASTDNMSSMSFSKIIKFAKKYELTFLTEKYFNDLHSTRLLM